MDRVSIDRLIPETLDPTYAEDWDIARLGQVAQVGHMMTGSIMQTAAGFFLQLNVSDTTQEVNTLASFSGTFSSAEIYDHSAMNRASMELLQQMGVQLTARSRNELGRASNQESIGAQAALARGINAERQGLEVAAFSFYQQAIELDPFLREAESRLTVASAAITGRNADTGALADIQWRNQWMARLRETEEFIASFLHVTPAFYLVYTLPLDELDIDYFRETATLRIDVGSMPEPNWFESVNKLIRTMRDGLNATGRADAWGLNWPAQTMFSPSPLAGRNTTHQVVMEVVDANGNALGRQTATIPFDLFTPDGGIQSGTIAPRTEFASRVSFPGIDVNALGGNMTVRVVSINGIDPESAVSRLGIRSLPEHEFNNLQSIRDNGLRTDNVRLYSISFHQNNHNRITAYRGGASASIPYGVTLIDQNSGLSNINLVSLTLPQTLTQIGISAFVGNGLNSVVIPDSVSSIGVSAFVINNITRISIGANVVQAAGGINFGVSFDNDFRTFYNNNNRRAGTYIHAGGNNWNFTPR
jgi:hypothetical protein